MRMMQGITQKAERIRGLLPSIIEPPLDHRYIDIAVDSDHTVIKATQFGCIPTLEKFLKLPFHLKHGNLIGFYLTDRESDKGRNGFIYVYFDKYHLQPVCEYGICSYYGVPTLPEFQKMFRSKGWSIGKVQEVYKLPFMIKLRGC